MEKVRRFFRRVFILPLWLTPLIALPAFVLVIWTLTHDVPEPLRFLSYHLSAYGLTVSVTAWVRIVPMLRRRWAWVSDRLDTPLGRLLRGDPAFRAWLGICLSMAWNLIYALAKLLVGAVLGSTWLRSMGIYYLVLAWLRFILVRPSLRDAPPEKQDWQRYRSCGLVLLVMNLVLMAVLVQVLQSKGSFRYPGPLIYLMAAYAFWAVSSAAIKLVRWHRRGDPRMSAARAISMTASMVSLLSLEIAMIHRFDNGDTSFDRVMIFFTGLAVCMIELGMALYMIRQGTRQLRQSTPML